MFSAVLLLCVQACLVQSIFSQCIRLYPTCSSAALMPPLTRDAALRMIVAPFVASVTAPLTDPFLAPTAVDACGAYGGDGIGETGVASELPASGTTTVAGEIPILGAVEFGGIVPAAGTISIAGTFARGCSETYI